MRAVMRHSGQRFSFFTVIFEPCYTDIFTEKQVDIHVKIIDVQL